MKSNVIFNDNTTVYTEELKITKCNLLSMTQFFRIDEQLLFLFYLKKEIKGIN